MKTIWKFPIKITDYQVLTVPINWEPIHVGLDPQGTPCIWAEVDSEKKTEPCNIYVYGTGHQADIDTQVHIGSLVQGPFVWHVYRDGRK
jgi:hypothetical protein